MISNVKPIVGIDVRLVTANRTGDAMVFRYLTRALIATHPEFSYRLYTDITDAESLERLRDLLGCDQNENVEFVVLRHARNRFIWNAWTLPCELTRHPVDIYHTQYIAPLWLPSTVKLVTHVHDVSFAAHPEWIGTFDRWFLQLLIPRSLRRSQCIVAPSAFTREEIATFYPWTETKLAIVPNAVGEEWSTPPADAARAAELHRAVQEKFKLPARYIIASGTMQPRKNIPYLIEAWQERPPELQAVGLVLTGNPEGHHVDRQVRSAAHQDIIFTGYVSLDELRVLIAGAEVLAFPSRYEGFGIPILEAFAAGVPVWAAHIPPFIEVGGEAIAFFDLGHLAQGKKILYSLCTNEIWKQRLVQAGRVRLSVFDWRRSAAALAAAYQSVLSE